MRVAEYVFDKNHMRHIPSSDFHKIYLTESATSNAMRYYYEILRKYTREREIFVLS